MEPSPYPGFQGRIVASYATDAARAPQTLYGLCAAASGKVNFSSHCFGYRSSSFLLNQTTQEQARETLTPFHCSSAFCQQISSQGRISILEAISKGFIASRTPTRSPSAVGAGDNPPTLTSVALQPRPRAWGSAGAGRAPR